ncbi:alpha/beta fold hydrolase [Bacteroidota bacterium]
MRMKIVNYPFYEDFNPCTGHTRIASLSFPPALFPVALQRKTHKMKAPTVFCFFAAFYLVFSISDITVGQPNFKDNIKYSDVGGEELKLDLAQPSSGDGPFPLIICLHGGGWSAGHRNDVRWLLPQLTQHGYIAVTVSYRFAPNYPMPAQIYDVKAAVCFLRANAVKYNIDSDRIGVIGFSSGGHLAMMLALTDHSDGLEGYVQCTSTKIQAAVNFVGTGDFTNQSPPLSKEAEKVVQEYYHTTYNELRKGIFGTLDVNDPIYTITSPITYIDKNDPPILSLHGTEDEFISSENARHFDQAMKNTGAQHEMVLYEGEGHHFSQETMKIAIDKSFRFLDDQLKR